MYTLEQIALEQIKLDLPAKKVLLRIKPILNNLINRENTRSIEHQRGKICIEKLLEEMHSLLSSIVHGFVASYQSPKSGEFIISEMQKEINNDPEGESTLYGHLSYSLTQQAIDQKSLYRDSTIDSYSEEELWAVYILVMLQNYVNTNGRDRRYLDISQEALSLCNSNYIKEGRTKQRANKLGGKETAKRKKLEGDNTKSKVTELWHTFNHIPESNRASKIAQRLDKTPQHIRKIIKQLNLKKRT